MTLKASLICSSPQERDALVARLGSMPGVEINVHVGNARTLLPVMQKERPDVVLLDFPVADEPAFEQIEAATLRVPGMLVVLVSPDSSMDLLKRAMHAGVRDILPAPMSRETVELAVDYLEESHSINSRFINYEGGLLAFLPAKGGSGCTFLASNLGYTLAAGGKSVLLMDLNLHFGDMVNYVTDRKPVSSIVDIARQSHRLDAALLQSSVLNARENLHLLAAPALPFQTEVVTPETLANIITLARSQYDFVILDLGRTLDPTTIKVLDLADHIYLILQPSLPAIQDVQRIATVLRGLGFSQDKLNVVLNCFNKQGVIRLEEVERATKTKVTRTIPASYDAVMASINQGTPLPMLSARDAVSRALQDWAQDLSPVAVKQRVSWFETLTGGLAAAYPRATPGLISKKGLP